MNHFIIKITKTVDKNLKKLPKNIQEKFVLLLNDLKDTGPIQPNWANFSKLGQNKYHCHLTYKYVACWRWETGSIIVEVYYAGSREKAPY